MGGESAATEAARVPSLRELFEAHYAFVWRTMRHFGLDEASADDAAQDTFVVVHRRLADYDGRTHIRGWLYGIARRVVHHGARCGSGSSSPRAVRSAPVRRRPRRRDRAGRG